MFRRTSHFKKGQGNRCAKCQFKRRATRTRRVTTHHSTHPKRFQRSRRLGNQQAAHLGLTHLWDCLWQYQSPSILSGQILKRVLRRDTTLFYYLASQIPRTCRAKTPFYHRGEALRSVRLQDTTYSYLARTSQTTHPRDMRYSTHKRGSRRTQQVDSPTIHAVQAHLDRFTQLGCHLAARACAGAFRPRRLVL